MKYPKILLTGGTGQLGHELKQSLRSFGHIWAPTREEFDLLKPETLKEKIQNFGPSIIVNSAAFTSVDEAENKSNLARLINVESPKLLAKEAAKREIPLIQYSTDYIFDGKKRQAYTELDKPNPLNVYGQTKLEGEENLKKIHELHLIVRTSWVYNPNFGKNFYRTIVKHLRERDQIQVVNDQVGIPTSAHFVANNTSHMLNQLDENLQKETRWGIYHLTQDKIMSWYDFALQIKHSLNRTYAGNLAEIIAITSDQLSCEATRPEFSVLDTTKYHSTFC